MKPLSASASLRLGLRLAIAAAALATPHAAEAASWLENRLTTLAPSYLIYTAEDGKGLTSSSKAYGFDASTEQNNPLLGLRGRFRFELGSGKTEFNDGGTPTDLSFTLMSGECALGPRLNLIPAKELAVRPYVGVAGVFGVTRLRLPEADYAALVPSQTSMHFGYEISAGMHFGRANRGRGDLGYFVEAQLRRVGANLGGTSGFRMDGIRLQGGVTW